MQITITQNIKTSAVKAKNFMAKPNKWDKNANPSTSCCPKNS